MCLKIIFMYTKGFANDTTLETIDEKKMKGTMKIFRTEGSATHLQSLFATLDLYQSHPYHMKKEYTLDLVFSTLDSLSDCDTRLRITITLIA